MSPVLVCGVDEAGLGPLLGPLAIGYACMRLPSAEANPWSLLSSVVARNPAKDKNRLVVADSKKVFTRNDRGRRRLEATVLAFLAQLDPKGRPPGDPGRLLFGRLHPRDGLVARHPWYARLPKALPVDLEAGTVELAAFRLGRRMQAAGLELVDAGVRMVPSGELNASYGETSNKAQSVWEKTLEVLTHLWEAHGHDSPRVVLDRQGARARYGSLLAQGLPTASVKLVREVEGLSEYELTQRRASGPRRRRMALTIVEKAEDHSFPVALASCIAKYGRELSMGAFNAFFGELQPGLKPTAGYRNDGWRWLEEAKPAVRRARVPEGVLIRSR